MWRQPNKKRGETAYVKPQKDPWEAKPLTACRLENLILIRQAVQDTADLVVHKLTIAGIPATLLLYENTVDLIALNNMILQPMAAADIEAATPEKVWDWIWQAGALGVDMQPVYTLGELLQKLMSGFAGILVDGVAAAAVSGVQGFPARGVEEPSAEVNLRGSREGFVERVRINMTMLRRRIKSPSLKMELLTVGAKSRTDVCLVYMTDMVSPELLRDIRSRIGRIPTEIILESGYIQPFLDTDMPTIFSNVGTTERPDTLCAKVAEGRVGVLVDGSPHALVVPSFFCENFQSVDDYTHLPYYALFVRALKYISFFVTILLPGVYVAVGSYHPELLPPALLQTIAAAESTVPFSMMWEALIIHFVYELMREAGLRLPRPVSHAVGIVGALVIGDAAVSAGLIGAPMVMVVALTALGSFVVPSLFQEVTILRFSFILIGGFTGLFGVWLGLALVVVNLCAVNPYGIPASSPESPFGLRFMRDVLVRAGWERLGRRTLRIDGMPGSEKR